MITKDDVRRALPAELKSAATDDLADKLNNISTDPVIAENVRDNFISYTSVLREGRFKINDYLNAVKYVSLKLLGKNNLEAYSSTFPDRYADMIARGLASKDINSYVHAYHKGKLVNLIMEQTLVPTWVLNADNYQKAINTQVEIMLDPTIIARDRVAAANSVMTHLGKPKEAAQLSINIAQGENRSSIDALTDALTKLSSQQREVIESGQFTAKAIAADVIIDSTGEEINE